MTEQVCELYISVKNFLVLSVRGRLLPLSKHYGGKQKHNEEAGGEKVPQSRDGHSAHAPITAVIFLFGQRRGVGGGGGEGGEVFTNWLRLKKKRG